jgi:nucleoside-diphosphate-sugar epimerase
MKIFLAGGSGVVGRHLIPELVRRGHDVVATTTSAAKAPVLEAAGADPLVLDLLGDGVAKAVERVGPDVVVHQATSLSRSLSWRKFDKSFEETNLLRTKGLDNLLAAAVAADSARFVAQSFTGWPNERRGGPVKKEVDALDERPPKAARESLRAIRALEYAVTSCDALEGVVVRYGGLYGPGTSLGAGGEIVELLERRKVPLVGHASGIWSFVHVADAAQATVLAIEGRGRGVYNIVDDEPAPVSEWLPYLARALEAPPPRRIPAWLARPLIGEFGVTMMTEVRGSSNEKAKRELRWELQYASWREGFAHGLGTTHARDERRQAA